MAQGLFLIVEENTVARTLKALICQISVLIVSNFKRKMIKLYACCAEIKLHLYLFIPICKHYGIHSCLLKQIGRNKDAEDIACSFPRITRESFIRQKLQQELEENSSRDAVETAKSLTDKTFIDNVRKT